jgi:hypothetical protein
MLFSNTERKMNLDLCLTYCSVHVKLNFFVNLLYRPHVLNPIEIRKVVSEIKYSDEQADTTSALGVHFVQVVQGMQKDVPKILLIFYRHLLHYGMPYLSCLASSVYERFDSMQFSK